MKTIRIIFVLAVVGLLGACATADLKSPCACKDGIKPRINQQA